MSKIKLTLPGLEIPVNGKQVTFKAPCDCSVVECIEIDGIDYAVVDSLGNVVTGNPAGGTWASGAKVSVILDVDNRKAYLLNGALAGPKGSSHAFVMPIPKNPLGSMSIGTKIKLNETINGVTTAQDFIVAEKNYNGTGRVLVLRDQLVNQRVAHSSGPNYSGGSLDVYCNETYISYLEADIQAQITDVPIASTSGYSSTVNTINRKGFALSAVEMGSSSNHNTEGALVSYFNASDVTTRRISYLSGTATAYWTRTPGKSSGIAYGVKTDGNLAGNLSCTSLSYVRPAFTLPSDFGLSYVDKVVDASGAVVGTQIKTGVYYGTGTYGESAPVSLTFDFEPEMLMVMEALPSATGTSTSSAFFVASKTMYGYLIHETNGNNFISNNTYLPITWNGKTVSWYGGTANNQMNATNRTYHYIAIG